MKYYTLIIITIFLHFTPIAQTTLQHTSTFSVSPSNHRDTTAINNTISQYNYISAQSSSTTSQHLPYPILFVHGLQSSSDTWLNFYNYALTHNLSYGGTVQFCLNSDNNLYFSDLTDMIDYTGTLQPADFYLLNFNLDANGTAYGTNANTVSQSNMASIVKQGQAIKLAINHILQATGRGKVILFGHSMGGLASREYIQNPSLWQVGGLHHIAKLATTGTPHGGSNATATIVGSLFVPDESSDAVRDLRTTYFYSGASGVYLYGGLESNATMNDQLFSNFYNVDVNCNGVIGEHITGLNQKSMPTDLDLSCIIGNWWSDVLGGDGVVSLTNAQIKNFYPVTSETFTVNANHITLTSLIKESILALDEPDTSLLSYEIFPNTTYTGYTTTQATDANKTFIDDDYFSFTQTASGPVSVTANFYNSGPYLLQLINSAGTLVFSQSYTTTNVNTTPTNLSSDTYKLKISTVPNDTSWKHPFNFIVNTSSISTSIWSIGSKETTATITIQPNPFLDDFIIESDVLLEGPITIEIYNNLGELIYQEVQNSSFNKQVIYTDKLPIGILFLKLQTKNGLIYNKRLMKLN